LEGTPGDPPPNPLPKQGHPEQAVEDLVQPGLEYLQRRRLPSPSGQPGPGLCHPQREEVLPHGRGGSPSPVGPPSQTPRAQRSRCAHAMPRRHRPRFPAGSTLTSSMPWGKGLSSQSFSGKRCRICPCPSPLPAETRAGLEGRQPVPSRHFGWKQGRDAPAPRQPAVGDPAWAGGLD